MEKGISPLIAAVILIAMVVAVAGIVGVFFTQFTRTTVGGVESGAAAQVSCAGVYIDVVSYNSTDGKAIFRNPSGNSNVKIYITQAVNSSYSTSITITPSFLSAGQLSQATSTNVISSDRVDFFGFCEVGTTNASISGSCSFGQSCWKK